MKLPETIFSMQSWGTLSSVIVQMVGMGTGTATLGGNLPVSVQRDAQPMIQQVLCLVFIADTPPSVQGNSVFMEHRVQW